MKAIIVIFIIFLLIVCASIAFGIMYFSSSSKLASLTPSGSEIIAKDIYDYVFNADKTLLNIFKVDKGVLTISQFNPEDSSTTEFIKVENINSISDLIHVDSENTIAFLAKDTKQITDRQILVTIDQDKNIKKYEITDERISGLRVFTPQSLSQKSNITASEIREICDVEFAGQKLEYDFNVPYSLINTGQIKDPILSAVIVEEHNKFVPFALCGFYSDITLVELANSPVELERDDNVEFTRFTTTDKEVELTFKANPTRLSNFDGPRDYMLKVFFNNQTYDFGYSYRMNVLSSDQNLQDSFGNLYILRTTEKKSTELIMIPTKLTN